MKSIDKLRRMITEIDMRGRADENNVITVYMSKGERRILESVADEIEVEIAERYMELPMDADSAPIHVGDFCEANGEQFDVRLLKTDGDCWRVVNRLGGSYPCWKCHHVKPRTLEDVLIEYRLKAYNLYADQELTGEERVDEFIKLDAEYDSEIRELLLGR